MMSDSNSAKVFYAQGREKMTQSDFEGAIRDFDKVISLDPKYRCAYCNRGDSKAELHDQKGAIDDYTEALRIDPNHANAYHHRGNAKSALSNLSEAIDDYSEAIRLDPQPFTFFYSRGRAKFDLGQYKSAIEDYDAMIRLNPNFATGYDSRATAKHELGDVIGSIEDYDKAIELEPAVSFYYDNRGNAKSQLGFEYESRGNKKHDLFKQALRDYDRAIELVPNFGKAHNNRGLAKSGLGDFEKALEDFDAAIRLCPDEAYIYCNRGNIKLSIGDNQGATNDYNKCLELDASFLTALFTISQRFLPSTSTEHGLYENRLRYSVASFEALELWRKGNKTVDLESEIFSQYSAKANVYWQFLYWLQNRLADTSEFTEETHLQYQVLYISYFLLESPDLTFTILNDENTISKFNGQSPLDRYFLIQSAWRILESKQVLHSLIEISVHQMKSAKSYTAYEKVFQEFITRTDVDNLSSLYQPSNFYPYYRSLDWEASSDEILHSLDTKSSHYSISIDGVDWLQLLKTLLGAYALGKPLTAILEITDEEAMKFKMENFGTAVEKSIAKHKGIDAYSYRNDEVYQRIINTPFLACEDVINKRVIDKKMFEISAIAFLDKYKNQSIDKEQFSLLTLYAFLHYTYHQHKDDYIRGKKFMQSFAVEFGITSVSVSAGLPFWTSILFSTAINSTVDEIVSQYFVTKNFPSLKAFQEDLAERLQSL